MEGCGQATPGQPLHKGSRLIVGSNTNCSSLDLDMQYYIHHKVISTMDIHTYILGTYTDARGFTCTLSKNGYFVRALHLWTICSRFVVAFDHVFTTHHSFCFMSHWLYLLAHVVHAHTGKSVSIIAQYSDVAMALEAIPVISSFAPTYFHGVLANFSG